MALFKLESVVDRGESVRPGDIRQTKQALTELGFYQVPAHGITDFTDDEMFEGIEAFQRDRKLRVDGMMIPNGRTERAINDALKGGLRKRAGSSDSSTALGSAGALGEAGFDLLRPPFALGQGQFASPVNYKHASGGGDQPNKTRNSEVAMHPGLGRSLDSLFGSEDRSKKMEKSQPDDEKRGVVDWFLGNKHSRSDVGEANVREQAKLPEDMIWSKHERYIIEGRRHAAADIWTEGPVRITFRMRPPKGLGSATSDINYVIRWFARDKFGERIKKSVKETRYKGEVKGAGENVTIDGAIGGTIKPPFDSEHGYIVEVEVGGRFNDDAALVINGSQRRRTRKKP